MRQSHIRHPRRWQPVSIDVLEDRRLMSFTLPAATPITIGSSTVHDVIFTASNGRSTTVVVSNAQAILSFEDAPAVIVYKRQAVFTPGIVQTLDSITLINATPGKAVLTIISTTPGQGAFNVQSITGGSLAAINAVDVNLTGSLNVQSVKNVTLSSISGANVNLGSVGSNVKIVGAVSGDFTAGSLKSLSAGSLSNLQLTTTDDFSPTALEIGSINIAHAITDSTIASSGNIGVIKAGAIVDSVITAAANPLAAPVGQTPAVEVPVTSSVFSDQAIIHTVKVPLGNVSGSFTNSIITAYTLGSLQMGEIDGGGGIAAHTFNTVSGVGPTGELNRIFFHLGAKQLHTTAKLQSALSNLGIAYLDGSGSSDSTVIYGFNINLLG